MKSFAFLSLVIFLSFSGTGVHAQTKCKVLLSAIAGTYTGGCKQGKADGNGKAAGTDQYTGQFKGGLPEGKGTYIWANGDTFEGLWRQGKRDGPGSMLMKDGSKISGFWENDVHIGNYDKPFVINQRGGFITEAELKKDNDSNERSIQLNISNTTGGGVSLLGGTFPRPDLTDILVTKGSYTEVIDGLETQRSISKKILKIIFPFRARLTIDGQYFDFEIFQPGAWAITLVLQNHTAREISE